MKYRVLGSRYNTEGKRNNNGAHSSTLMQTESVRPRRENIWREVAQTRPCRKKSHISGACRPNPDMREGVGTSGSIILTRRFPNSRLTCVCKTSKRF